jgi:aspartyl-tRNA(Asn)/glutamyl-tRNA(Gln) amidotransferase subunit A
MYSTLTEIRRKLESHEITLAGLVQHYLQKIEDSNHLNIYIEVFGNEALERAQQLDAKYKKDPKSVGILYGLVMSIKDVLCYIDHEVTASSKILEGFRSQFTSTAVQRALDQDAIIIGRTNCDEFAMGSSNEHSVYGPTLNGADPSRIPGGSSGAAAVSVQMDTCLVALGSDTGGSVRQPASFCGVYGMKPTYGRISRYGLIAYASSFDQIGILSKDIEVMSLTLNTIEGYDQYDGTSAQLDTISTKPTQKSYSFTYFPEVINHPKLSKEIKQSIESKITSLKEQGHTVEPSSFDLIDYLVPCYYVLTTAEASSNLSRFDGVRYGHQAENFNTIEELYTKSRSEGFGTEVKRRIMMGTFVLSVGYFDAYFTKAQKVRQLINTKIQNLFDQHDFILMPTTTDIAWKIGEKVDDPIEMYLSDIFTVLANLCALPAISIPQPVVPGNMPIGIQILAQKFDDHRLLEVSRYL